MAPPHFTIDRKRITLGGALCTVGLLLTFPAVFVEAIWQKEPSGRLMAFTFIPAVILVIAGVIVLYHTRRCPRCEKFIKPDVVPHRVATRGGSFYCPYCGAEIRIE